MKILLGSAVAACVLAVTPGVANAAVEVVAPSSVPAGKAGIVRVDGGADAKTCTLTARSGKTVQGPFRSKAKPAAIFNFDVPADARNGRWTLSVRCAKTTKALAKAKPGTVRMTVTTTRSGGTRRLVAPRSVRTTASGVAEFFPAPGGECAAAWNGYRSKLDDTGLCTGYDTWYAFKLTGSLPQLRGLGSPSAEWQMSAQARGLRVSKEPIVRSVAWWGSTATRAGRVAFVEHISGTGVTIKEMNRKRWNVATTRTLRFGTEDAPDFYISLPPQSIDNGSMSVGVDIALPPSVPAPVTILNTPPRGSGHTAEILGAYQVGPAANYFALSYGADNVFRGLLSPGLQGVPMPSRLFGGDVDADGNGDLTSIQAPAGTFSPYLTVARSNGDGSFKPQVSSFPVLPAYPDAAAVLDADLDGKTDIVTVEQGPAYVVALANGDGTFSRSAPVSLPTYPDAIVAGDFDGDGKADVLADDGVLRSNGDGTFTRIASSGVTTTELMAAGDVNGDGLADVFTTDNDSGSWEYGVALSDGDGTFTAQPRYPGPRARQLASGDINGDGKLDFVTTELVVGSLNATYIGFLGAGDGTFTRMDLATGPTLQGLAVADIDGR